MSAVGCHRHGFFRRCRFLGPLVACLLSALGAAPPAPCQESESAAAKPPLDYYASAGVYFGRYSDGRGDGQFVTLAVSRPSEYVWYFLASREGRFGESGLAVGVSHYRFWKSGLTLGAGINTGTSRALHPNYEAFVSVGNTFFRRVIASLAYVRREARDEYASDGFLASASLYAGDHWVLSASGRYYIGYPGRTVSKAGALGIAYYTYRRTYVGAGFDYGDSRYMALPSRSLVESTTRGYTLSFSQYLGSSFGVGGRFGHDNYYGGGSASLWVFKEW